MLTQSQRNLAYEKIFRSLKDSYRSYDNSYSICRTINNISGTLPFRISSDYKYMKENLPELILFSPFYATSAFSYHAYDYNNWLNYPYWVKKEDLKTRKIILEFCIAMTE